MAINECAMYISSQASAVGYVHMYVHTYIHTYYILHVASHALFLLSCAILSKHASGTLFLHLCMTRM